MEAVLIYKQVDVKQLLQELAHRGFVINLYAKENIEPINNFLSNNLSRLIPINVDLRNG